MLLARYTQLRFVINLPYCIYKGLYNTWLYAYRLSYIITEQFAFASNWNKRLRLYRFKIILQLRSFNKVWKWSKYSQSIYTFHDENRFTASILLLNTRFYIYTSYPVCKSWIKESLQYFSSLDPRFLKFGQRNIFFACHEC